MSSGEQETHSFIIKLWLDQEGDAESRGWHGQITHVPGGERQSLKSLEDILKFIAPFVISASATSAAAHDGVFFGENGGAEKMVSVTCSINLPGQHDIQVREMFAGRGTHRN